MALRAIARRALVAIALAALLAAAIAYYSAPKPPGTGGEGGGTRLIGSGSTLLYPQLSLWIQEFMDENPGIVIEYSPMGSGAGQAQFFQGVIDFAGTDPPLSKNQWERYRGRVLQVPVIATAVAVVYNVPGAGELRLSPGVIAEIFRGEIEYWDDPRIASLNPGAQLPHERIIVVHRSDASGTTMVFTYYLHAAAPEKWPREMVGKTIEWSVDATGRGVGGKGNQGVADLVIQNRYSIGYVELAYALQHRLSIAAIENRDGVYVKPTREAIESALLSAADRLPSSPLSDWSTALNATINAPGEKSYPITTLSFLVFWRDYSAGKAEAAKKFLQWIAEKGYERVVEGYVALPEKLRSVALEASRLITAGEG